MGGLGRRRFLTMGLAGLGGLAAGAALGAQTPAASGEEEVTPDEDLMREHGALRRILLIYEEIRRRTAAGHPPLSALADSAGLIRRFVEDYHEKLEEDHIFPAFEKAGRLADLTKVLRAQHQAGRAVTAQLLSLAAGKSAGPQANTRITGLIAEFIRMYRPHAAREDTVLFPRFPRVVGHAQYEKLGDAFEDRERQLFGENGFEKIVGQVQKIEEQLGIYSLAQFTPKT